MISKLYVHKVLNRLSPSQLRQLAGEFKKDSSGSKSQLISRLINPVQIGGTDPIDYWKIGGQLEALLLSHIDSYTGELNTPIEQIKNILDEAKIKYDYSPQEWFKILLSSKIINKIEPPFDSLPVFVNSLNVLPQLSYGELKILNSYYPKTLNISQETLEAKRQSDLVELRTWLASYGKKYSIEELSNLDWLYLSSALSQLDIVTLSRLKQDPLNRKMISLFLNHSPKTPLLSMPDSIGALSNLRELNLSNSKLETLPDSIGNLSNLKVLALRETPLQSLPDSIENLSKLTELDLRGTQLTSLPVVQRLRNRGVTIYT